MSDFAKWFKDITGNLPYPYQERFATDSELPIILNVPTGAGKTATVILGWYWRRIHFPEITPRRLVYCLPMRTLVEQTYNLAHKWFTQILSNKPEIYLLMGGAISQDWDENPEADCILIGTQDQLLSKALNRGYGMSRNRWSIHFALLNNDCLWVMDEVQLMGAGLQTSAQLQGFREIFGTYAPVKSLWMSATLNKDLLQTVDYAPDTTKVLTLTQDDEAHPVLKPRINAVKRLEKAQTVFTGKNDEYAKALAKEVVSAHIQETLTIVIFNQVQRAQAVYLEVKKLVDIKPLLVHSRFRPVERDNFNKNLSNHMQGILIATQAIEAGVDISARTLFTELAPWSSLVQRFGRCNRYGEYSEGALVYWIDIDLKKKDKDKIARPYEVEILEPVQELLQNA